MKCFIAVAILALVTIPAFAADAPVAPPAPVQAVQPSDYAPYTIDENSHKAMLTILGQLPYQNVAQIIQFLNQQEAIAQAAAHPTKVVAPPVPAKK